MYQKHPFELPQHICKNNSRVMILNYMLRIDSKLSIHSMPLVNLLNNELLQVNVSSSLTNRTAQTLLLLKLCRFILQHAKAYMSKSGVLPAIAPMST